MSCLWYEVFFPLVLQPRNGQGALLIIMAVLRVVYIPLLMMCHIDSGSNSYLKNLLNNDAWPIALILTLGLTNGYLGTLSMMYGPRSESFG